VIARILPAGVAVAVSTEDVPIDAPFDVEHEAIARAVPKRRQEFLTGRTLARRALAQLGIEPVAIPSGPRGEPLWPEGVAASITHCAGYRACAAVRIGAVRSLGIDAEVHAPLPAGVLGQIAFGPELAAVAVYGDGVHLDAVMFSAKESVYKAWFPLTGRWLGFDDVEMTLDPAARRFSARLLVAGPDIGGRPLTAFEGRYAVGGGVVATAVVVPAAA
jgi:4'-phosphopantetheinyl transferase EntD